MGRGAHGPFEIMGLICWASSARKPLPWVTVAVAGLGLQPLSGTSVSPRPFNGKFQDHDRPPNCQLCTSMSA
jgi:hypothetical protein